MAKGPWLMPVMVFHILYLLILLKEVCQKMAFNIKIHYKPLGTFTHLGPKSNQTHGPQ